MDKKRIFVLISAVFVGFMVHAAFDLMTSTTAPWKKKKPDQLTLTDDSLSAAPSFSDTTIYYYKVHRNDALSTIADRFNCRIEFIKELNQLTSDKIAEKQIIRVPIRALHRVQKNEFIEKIARQYEVDSKEIMEANHLSRPEQLRADQEIVIPKPNQ